MTDHIEGKAAIVVNDTDVRPLTGYEVQQFHKAVATEVAKRLSDSELRKWCVDQAVRAVGIRPDDKDVCNTAISFYAFISGATREQSG